MAFVIVAYKDPSQIERLIKKFDRDGTDFYIHLDKKISISNFVYLKQIGKVYFIKTRVKVNWVVLVLLQGFWIHWQKYWSSGRKYDFISIVSGQDYLIKPVASFYSYLENNLGKNFIFFEDPGDKWWTHAITRINQYHMTIMAFRGRYRLQFFINRILPKRKFPLPYKMYGGPCATSWPLLRHALHTLLISLQSTKGQKILWVCMGNRWISYSYYYHELWL